MPYRRSGRSGLLLPAISLGLWQGFGGDAAARDEPRDRAPRVRSRHHALRPREQLRPALRLGRGDVRRADAHRPRAVPRRARDLDQGRLRHVARARTATSARASTCSRASTRASTRMGLEYVDIFYSHRADPETPLEETMGALATAVRAGQGAVRRHLVLLARADRRGGRRSCATSGTPLLIHQPSYSMLNRWIEDGLLDTLEAGGRRLHHVLAARAGPAHEQVPARHPGGIARERGRVVLARAADRGHARPRARARRDRARARSDASRRWRSPGRCAIARVTSTLIGASSVAQLEDNVGALEQPRLLAGRARRDRRLTRDPDGKINLWARSSAV